MKRIRSLMIGIGVAVVASIPLMLSGLWKNGTGHDMFFHLLRIAGLSTELEAGQFPVRIQSCWYNGYGYANSVFYGDLFLLFPALLHVVGVSLQLSYKVFLFCCNFATFMVAKFSLKGMTGNERASLVGASWYTISLYRLINVYVRHAVGEHTAMIFFPLVAYALFCLLKQEPNLNAGLKSLIIGMSGILQSHIISFELTVGAIAVACLIYVKEVIKKETFLAFVKGVLITIAVNLWFLIPLFDYMKTGTFNANTVSEYKSSLDIGESGLFISQLFGVKYGASGVNLPASEGIKAEMPLGVGMSALLILILGLLTIISGIVKKDDKKILKFNTVIVAGSIASLWMSTIYFPWGAIEGIHKGIRYAIVNIQFPWRFLGLASAFLAICFCRTLVTEGINGAKTTVVVVSMTLVTISAVFLLTDEVLVSTNVTVKELSDLNTCEPSGEEYLPYGTNVNELEYGDVRTTNAVCTDWSKNNSDFYATCENNTEETGYLLAPMLYYKGYVAEMEDTNQELEISYGDNKRILVAIPPKTKGNIHIFWEKPSLWWVGDIASLVCIIGLVAGRKYVFYDNNKR